MNATLRSAIASVFALAASAVVAAAQAPAPAASDAPPPMFASEGPLTLTITANLDRIRGDRKQESPWRAATISYAEGGKAVTVPLRIRTHGIWRLAHCEFPPLRFNISNKLVKGTLLYDLQKPKLVSPCHDTDRFEQLVLQEYQLYRIYQLLTPASHRARLLRLSYADSASGKVEATRYAFLIEDPDEMADRLGGKLMKVKGAGPDDMDSDMSALAFLFEYLIGNTDFSFNGLHNGELIARNDGSPLVPVGYDFDFSGAVNAPYATPDPRLHLNSVRQRLFRGYCRYYDDYPGALLLMQEKRDAIMALYTDDIGKLMDDRTRKEGLRYLDDFFSAMKDPAEARRELLGRCVGPR